MDVTRAIDLLSNVTYRPEWHWTVKSHENRFKQAVVITFYYNVRDTAYSKAPAYEEFVEIFASWVLLVGELNEERLYAEFFKLIMQIELHESREFFSVQTADGDYSRKPFHPHRHDGMVGYARAAELSEAQQIVSDLNFGTAYARQESM